MRLRSHASSPTGITISRCTPHQRWRVVDHLQRDARRHGVARGRLDFPSFWHDLGAIAAAPLLYAAVDARGRLVGYAVLEGEETALYIPTLEILPSHRRRGAGAAVVRLVADLARERGWRRLRLRPVNGSEGFWARMGFEVVDDGSHRAGSWALEV